MKLEPTAYLAHVDGFDINLDRITQPEGAFWRAQIFLVVTGGPLPADAKQRLVVQLRSLASKLEETEIG